MTTTAAPLLEARNLSVSVGGICVCRDLELTLHPGECLAVLGRNGAGKSTLLSVLAGLRVPQAGEVLVNGSGYALHGPRRSALIRGWLPQARGDAFASTVLETALVGRHPHLARWDWEGADDAMIARNALAAVDLAKLEQRDVLTLSGGERQRLAIAALLAQAPQLFLLDEPIAHLDLKHQISILELFAASARDFGAGVIMVVHEPALAWRYCDRALLIYGEGRTKSGPAREMLNAESLSTLYDYPMRAIECDGLISFIPS